MGVSTDGILFYGIPIDDDSDVHDRISSDDEVEDSIAQFKNYGNPDGGVSIGTHCSDGSPMYYIYIHEQVAARGYPKEVEFKKHTTWDRSLRAFCKKYDIPWQHPKWWLVSYWG